MSVSGIFRPFSELSGKMKVLSVQGWTAFAEADQETLEHSPTHHNDQHENDKLSMYTQSRLPNMHKHLCFLSLKSEKNNKEKIHFLGVALLHVWLEVRTVGACCSIDHRRGHTHGGDQQRVVRECAHS